MQPTPGIKTTEFWIMLLIVTVGALPSSGLFATDSVVLKVSGLIGAILAGMGYMFARTKLKVAHANAANDNAPEEAPAAIARAAQAGSASLWLITAMATVMVVSTMWACVATKKAATIVADDLADCTTGQLSKLAPFAASLALPVANGAITWDSAESAAIAMGGDVGACFLGDIADEVKAAAGSGGGMKAAPGGALALQHYREATGARRKIKTSTGVR